MLSRNTFFAKELTPQSTTAHHEVPGITWSTNTEQAMQRTSNLIAITLQKGYEHSAKGGSENGASENRKPKNAGKSQGGSLAVQRYTSVALATQVPMLQGLLDREKLPGKALELAHLSFWSFLMKECPKTEASESYLEYNPS